MQLSNVNQYFGNVDIYLLDLILKNRFTLSMKVLDAGCGEGRNLVYFLNAGFNVFGVDIDPKAINAVRFVAGSIRPDLVACKHNSTSVFAPSFFFKFARWP